MYRIDKIFHNIKERKLAKRLCERERERESLAGILIASIKAMLYDRMCKKIFRVDGMLLPLPVSKHRSDCFVYLTRKIEKNTIETRCMFEFSMKLYLMLVYKKLYPLYVLTYSISWKKTIKLQAFWFISVFLGFATRIVETDMSRMCYVFQILRTSSKNRVIWSSWWYRVKDREKYECWINIHVTRLFSFASVLSGNNRYSDVN